jgi:hypothetical protein
MHSDFNSTDLGANTGHISKQCLALLTASEEFTIV